MDAWAGGALTLLPDYLAQHVLVSACALAIGLLLGVSLIFLAMRTPWTRGPILFVANLIQTIPSLALLALFYPLLLGLSAITTRYLGAGIPAFGFLPSVSALGLYAILPILRNGIAGLSDIAPAVTEAARAVGMTPLQQLLLVKIPLAAPVVMAGVRTAAVWTIGAATLSTAVGQVSLGNFIFTGLQTEDWSLVLVGCVAAALLAILADWLLSQVEFGLRRRNFIRVAFGAAGLLIGTALAIAPLLRAAPSTYVVGAKNFGEQFILAELIKGLLVRQGFAVQEKYGLGSAVAFRALANGDIDVYVDYSGTLWLNAMGRNDILPRKIMLQELSHWLKSQYGIVLLGPLGFENAYALAMRRSRADAIGIHTIQDLAVKGSDFALGTDLEFINRPEWKNLREAYSLSFRSQRSFSPTIMYQALNDDVVDVISAFSSDGRIKANDLVVLLDTMQVMPTYDAVILISPKRANDTKFIKSISPLVGRISIENMREANYQVDRRSNKRSPKEAARFLAGTLSVPSQPGSLSR